MFLDTVTLSEFLYLVAALGRCFRWYDAMTYLAYLFCYRIPVSGANIEYINDEEGIPSLLVGLSVLVLHLRSNMVVEISSQVSMVGC